MPKTLQQITETRRKADEERRKQRKKNLAFIDKTTQPKPVFPQTTKSTSQTQPQPTPTPSITQPTGQRRFISPTGQTTTDPTQFKDQSQFKPMPSDFGKPTRYIMAGVDVGSKENFDLVNSLTKIDDPSKVDPRIVKAFEGKQKAQAQGRLARLEGQAREEATLEDLKTQFMGEARTERAKGEIVRELDQFGLETPSQEGFIDLSTEEQIQSQQLQPQTQIDITKPVNTQALTTAQINSIKEDIRRRIPKNLSQQEQIIFAQNEMVRIFGDEKYRYQSPAGSDFSLFSKQNLEETAIALGALSVAGLPLGYAVKGKVLVNPAAIIKSGVSLKNSFLAKSTFEQIGILTALWVGGEKAVDVVGNIFNRGVDEAQQGLNTLGTITSTIVGDSTSGRGDARAGLRELEYIERELIKLEKNIKEGKIGNVQLRISGKIIDINADIYDQLATIREGKGDIQSFILSGQFPELSEYETQQLMRELEDEGYIKPVDLTEARRPTSF